MKPVVCMESYCKIWNMFKCYIQKRCHCTGTASLLLHSAYTSLISLQTACSSSHRIAASSRLARGIRHTRPQSLVRCTRASLWPRCQTLTAPWTQYCSDVSRSSLKIAQRFGPNVLLVKTRHCTARLTHTTVLVQGYYQPWVVSIQYPWHIDPLEKIIKNKFLSVLPIIIIIC